MIRQTNNQHYLFSSQDLRALFPNLSNNTYKAILHRAAKSGLLTHVCRGLYVYEPAIPKDGLFLFHTAAKIRASHFNYISLETALSDEGIISQIPMGWIMIKSSGRTSIIDCGKFGTIEFVHTKRKPKDLVNKLIYDNKCGMWRANALLALEDMKNSSRNLDLINWDIANELI